MWSVKTLLLKAYSQNTIRLYKDEMMTLIKLLGDKPVTSLKKEHMKFICYGSYKQKNTVN